MSERSKREEHRESCVLPDVRSLLSFIHACFPFPLSGLTPFGDDKRSYFKGRACFDKGSQTLRMGGWAMGLIGKDESMFV